jgi:hypothetical protein
VGRRLTGMKGVLSTGSGEQEVHPWETLEFTPEGVYVYHHDSYETVTFFPIYTLRQVRMHEFAKERSGPNRPADRNFREDLGAGIADRASVVTVVGQGELGP